MPSEEEYWGLTIGEGRGAGWLSSTCRFRTHVLETINEIRRRVGGSEA